MHGKEAHRRATQAGAVEKVRKNRGGRRCKPGTCRGVGRYDVGHLPDLRPLRADQFGDYNYGTEVRHNDSLALTQLLITYHLLRAYGKDAPIPFARPIAALSRLESVPQDAPAAQASSG
jgi:hypothetical protein